MKENTLKYLKDKLKETINLFNNSKIKIFSDNSNVECFEEKSQHCKDLKKQYSLENFLGSLYVVKTSDFALFTEEGHLIILLSNNQTHIQSVNKLESVSFSEEKKFFKKKYRFYLDDNRSVYVPKESVDILKSLISEYIKYSFEDIIKIVVEKNQLEVRIDEKINNITINGFNILESLLKKYENEEFIIDRNDLRNKINGSSLNRYKEINKWDIDLIGTKNYVFGLISGVVICKSKIVFLFWNEETGERDWLLDEKVERFDGKEIGINKLSLSEINEIVVEESNLIIDLNTEKFNFELNTEEINFFKEFINNCKNEIESRSKEIDLEIVENEIREKERIEKLNNNKDDILKVFDDDGNGIIDIIEGQDDFMNLFKKHQKSIIEVDRIYVQQFVKVSTYLKTKKENIQSIFNSLKDITYQESLDEYIKILQDEIHTYNLILFNSLNMIVSLVEDDMITFYEIHEKFDELNMFNSKHEKDVSQKLTNIGEGLNELMYEIRNVGITISDSIQELTYVTENTNKQLTVQLGDIGSTLKVGNLINTINTYQNYKTKRRLNS
jgi:hypothetical protein